MYVLYSLLILILGVIVSPYLAYQAIRYKKYIGSLGQRMGYLPVSFNLDGEESIWIHAVSVGETMTVRALIADLRRRYPNLRIFLSTTTMAGQQVARAQRARRRCRVLSSARSAFHRPANAAAREAAAVRDDGNGDLAEPVAAMQADGRCDRDGQRPDLVALVSALQARAAVFQKRARRRRSVLHADGRVGAACHRYRRRSCEGRRDRQPEVRLARRAGGIATLDGRGTTACCDISG